MDSPTSSPPYPTRSPARLSSESLTTSPASLAALLAGTPGSPLAALIETAVEEAHRMGDADLRITAQALRLVAQQFEDEADSRLD